MKSLDELERIALTEDDYETLARAEKDCSAYEKGADQTDARRAGEIAHMLAERLDEMEAETPSAVDKLRDKLV